MKNRGRQILSSLALTAGLLVTFCASGGEKSQMPFVAVFAMEGRGSSLTPIVLLNLTEYLSTKLVECGYKVIPQDQIRARIVQQKKESHKTCYDQTCQIELGRELSAQKSLSSKVMRFSGTCQVTATLYDLQKAAAEKAATAGGACQEAVLLKTIDTVVSKLCQPTEKQQQVDESTQATAEFEQVLQNAQKIKEKKNRAANAWSAVQRMAGDQSLGLAERAALLKKYLTAFKGDNPYEKEAQKLLREISPGRLIVTTEPPGATIYADGEPLGPSPVSREVKALKVVVGARLPGYAADDQEVVVEPDQDARLNFEMRDVRPGLLALITEPSSASISVSRSSDGGAIDTRGQPASAMELPAGSYTIKATAEDYLPAEQTITIEAGKRLDVKLSLRLHTPGVLRVSTDPPGAIIAVGAETLGTSPVSRKMRPGKVTIDAAAEGFRKASREVEIVSERESEVHFALERAYPINPYKKWGHITFWPGLGLAAFGASAAYLAAKAGLDDKAGDLSAADQSRTWTGVMFAGLGGGCALMITGVILWVLSPGDREWFDSHGTETLSVTQSLDGTTLSIQGRF